MPKVTWIVAAGTGLASSNNFSSEKVNQSQEPGVTSQGQKYGRENTLNDKIPAWATPLSVELLAFAVFPCRFNNTAFALCPTS